MDRRQAMLAATASLIAGTASAADDMPHQHQHLAHPHAMLIQALGDCIAAGEICISHCLVLMGHGDATMAGCSKSVNQMLATCNALLRLAAQEARLLPALAKVAADACLECQKACQEHADKHPPCKACMDACDTCAKQCKMAAA